MEQYKFFQNFEFVNRVPFFDRDKNLSKSIKTDTFVKH